LRFRVRRGASIQPLTAQNQRTASASEQNGQASQSAARSIAAGTARIATATGLRQVLTMGALAATAAVVARFLGPRTFGLYAGGTAVFNLCLGFSDFGFSSLLLRELARRPSDTAELMGNGLVSQLLWSALLSVGLFVTGAVFGGTRGTVMMILSPAVALCGLAISRQIFSAQFRATPLLLMDVITTLLQCAVMLVLVLSNATVIELATNLCAWTCVSSVAALMLARGQTSISLPQRAAVVRFARLAAPIGMASVLASLYFSLDLTLLDWLAKPAALGRYAAAVRLLTLVVMVPGFIMSAGIPGLMHSGHDRARLSEFAGTLARWISLTAAPCAAALAVFALPILTLVYGDAYRDAAPLVRILMLAGGLTFVSNVTGIVMVTLGIIRPQLVFNTVALVFNVAGNILLVPKYGVIASAWLTVATEAIIVAYGLATLRQRINYALILRRVRAPTLAILSAGTLGLLLGPSSVVAPIGALLIFLVTSFLLDSWPAALGRAVAHR
jgi:O-antigen/teichoic acid export membrane protein